MCEDRLQSLAGYPFLPGEKEPEYLIKYTGRAHIHNEWVAESTLMKIAKRKCINFKRRFPEPCNMVESEWLTPERFVARRCAPANPGWEVLVKWKGQNYEACTWEVSTSSPLTLDCNTSFSLRLKGSLEDGILISQAVVCGA